MLRVMLWANEKDGAFERGLVDSLLLLERQGRVATWGRSRLTAGTDEQRAFYDQARVADVALVLLSKDLLNERDFDARLRVLQQRGEALAVVPVPVRASLWQQVRGLQGLQPAVGRDIGSLPPEQHDEALLQVVAAAQQAGLRARLRARCPSPADLDALCARCRFDQVLERFRPGMDWSDKARLLLSQVDAGELLAGLTAELRARTVGQALQAALYLDRSHQWDQVTRACGPDRSGAVLLLLYGHQSQWIGLFLRRVREEFDRQQRLPHRFVQLEFTRYRDVARSGADWRLRLRDALEREVGSGGVAELLQRATWGIPLFLQIGTEPICGRLDKAVEAGLREFLAQELPALLREVGPGCKVHVLLAVEYQRRGESLEPEVRRWVKGVWKQEPLRFCPVDEAELPRWQDVRSFLQQEYGLDEEDEKVQKIRGWYDEFCKGAWPSYKELAEFLDQECSL